MFFIKLIIIMIKSEIKEVGSGWERADVGPTVQQSCIFLPRHEFQTGIKRMTEFMNE